MNRYQQRVTELDPYYSKGKTVQTVSETVLSELEAHLGSTLPADYRKFITDFSGVCLLSSPMFTFQEVENPNSQDSIEQFYGLLPDAPSWDIAAVYDDYRRRIPSDLLPIGEDPGGNIVCLGIKGERRDKVYFWDNEREEMPPSPTPTDWEPGYYNASFVADSFDVFFFSLQPKE